MFFLASKEHINFCVFSLDSRLSTFSTEAWIAIFRWAESCDGPEDAHRVLHLERSAFGESVSTNRKRMGPHVRVRKSPLVCLVVLRSNVCWFLQEDPSAKTKVIIDSWGVCSWCGSKDVSSFSRFWNRSIRTPNSRSSINSLPKKLRPASSIGWQKRLHYSIVNSGLGDLKREPLPQRHFQDGET